MDLINAEQENTFFYYDYDTSSIAKNRVKSIRVILSDTQEIKRYDFNRSGLVIKTDDSYEFNPITLYEYDSLNQLLKKSLCKKDGTIEEYYSWTYTPTGKFATCEQYVTRSQVKTKILLTFQYNSKDQLLSIFEQIEGNEKKQACSFVYDAKGRIAERINYLWYYTKTDYIDTCGNVYACKKNKDSSNYNLSYISPCKFKDPDPEKKIKVEVLKDKSIKTTYKYISKKKIETKDVNGVLRKEERYFYTEGSITPGCFDIYYYNQKGQLIRHKGFLSVKSLAGYDDPKNDTHTDKRYEYYENGFLKKEVWYSKGKLESTYTYLIEFYE